MGLAWTTGMASQSACRSRRLCSKARQGKHPTRLSADQVGRGVQMMREAFVDRLDIWSTTAPTDFSWRSGIMVTAVLLAPTLAPVPDLASRPAQPHRPR